MIIKVNFVALVWLVCFFHNILRFFGFITNANGVNSKKRTVILSLSFQNATPLRYFMTKTFHSLLSVLWVLRILDTITQTKLWGIFPSLPKPLMRTFYGSKDQVKWSGAHKRVIKVKKKPNNKTKTHVCHLQWWVRWCVWRAGASPQGQMSHKSSEEGCD